MPVPKNRKSTRGLLVQSYAEKISAKLLEQYGETVKLVIGRKSGVYVLSKSGKPYYIGPASELPSRLHNHLKNRHAGKWDRFNFYAIGRKKYLRDLESILIRVAKPNGNKQTGGFGKNKNLRRKLRNEIIQLIKVDFDAD
jgi:predicted GIY-YIG superfamily endonuclease